MNNVTAGFKESYNGDCMLLNMSTKNDTYLVLMLTYLVLMLTEYGTRVSIVALAGFDDETCC